MMSTVRGIQGPPEDSGHLSMESLLVGGLRRRPLSGLPECAGRKLWLTWFMLALAARREPGTGGGGFGVKEEGVR